MHTLALGILFLVPCLQLGASHVLWVLPKSGCARETPNMGRALPAACWARLLAQRITQALPVGSRVEGLLQLGCPLHPVCLPSVPTHETHIWRKGSVSCSA